MEITFKPSPNFSKGRVSCKNPSLLVLHAMVGSYGGSIGWVKRFKNMFTNPKAKVSSHYLVSQKGEITQMVKDSDTAWHCYGFNSVSLGIEMEDKGMCMKNGDWITPQLLDAAAELCASLMIKYKINIANVLGHNDPVIQKFAHDHNPSMLHMDPGPAFDMRAFKALIETKLNATH